MAITSIRMIPELIAIMIGLVLIVAGSGTAYKGIGTGSGSTTFILAKSVTSAMLLSSMTFIISIMFIGESERVILNTFSQYISNFVLSLALIIVLAMTKVRFRLELAVYAFFMMLFTFMPFLGHISFRECLILEIIVSVVIIAIMDLPHKVAKEKTSGDPDSSNTSCIRQVTGYLLMLIGTALMAVASVDVVTSLRVDQYKILAAATICISISMLSVPISAVRNRDIDTAVTLTATIPMFNTIFVFLALELISMVDYL